MSATGDMLSNYRFLGEELNEFLYEGRVKKKIKKEHTKQELEEMLEFIRENVWGSYSDAKSELG